MLVANRFLSESLVSFSLDICLNMLLIMMFIGEFHGINFSTLLRSMSFCQISMQISTSCDKALQYVLS